MTATVIFALTYLLIATRRLGLLPIGRPAGALLGAVLMVAFGVLSPAESFAAINHDTIALLFGMMLLGAYLDRGGLFARLAGAFERVGRTPWGVLAAVALVSGALSALFVNDTVCLFLTPVVVRLCRRHRLPMGPYLIALATSANIGSAATLVGNPQNMIIGSLSGLGFGRFLLYVGPAAFVGLAVNVALLGLYYRRNLPDALADGGDAARAPVRPLPLAVAAGIVAAFFAGAHLGYATLAGVLVLMIAERDEPREAFARVDWALLVFFCCLFIVVEGFARTGVAERAWAAGAPYFRLDTARGLAAFTGLMVLGSNTVSNVPMVLLTGPHLGGLGDPALGWALLAFTTTIAGNLTLVGSVANLIVAEGAKEDYPLGFVEYLRFGLVSTAAVLVVGVPLVVAAAHWFG